MFLQVFNFGGAMLSKPKKIINAQTNSVLTVKPNSAEMSVNPCLAMTAVKPANSMEIIAYATQRSMCVNPPSGPDSD